MFTSKATEKFGLKVMNLRESAEDAHENSQLMWPQKTI